MKANARLSIPMAACAAFLAMAVLHGAAQAAPLDLNKTQDGPIETSDGKKKSFGESGKAYENENSRFSDESIKKIDALIDAGQYESVIGALEKVPTDLKLTSFLTKKAAEGHIPIMWLLAEKTVDNRPLESAKWLYAGIIGIWQDSSVCLDADVSAAASDAYVQRFSKAYNGSRRLSTELHSIVPGAIDFWKNVKNPKNPLWLCSKHSKKIISPSFYDEKHWNELRKRERNKIRAKLGRPDAEKEPE